MGWRLLGDPAVTGCKGRAGQAGILHWGRCTRRGAGMGGFRKPPRVQGVEAPVQRGKCGLTFSPGWPFPPWGDHMQHGVQGREREGGREKRKDERETHAQEVVLMA